ncbi:hypothetical protein F444_23034 [Phytophthora nicotianae P1976]|uniref:Uncharacterized protein n=1 Tax=Phytophthora nicotianae P1976 TaxID=1317066 RepID=A0A080YW27_PHYNI|nr:hypothetical protein F444_23034 [Phytophthora nicotianae P1976]
MSGKKAEKARKMIAEDLESEYSFSDEGKVAGSKLKNREPAQKRPMRLRIRLSKTTKARMALVDTVCSTSNINAALLELNRELDFKLLPFALTYEQVDGYVKAAGAITVMFRFMDLNYGTRITHTFSVLKEAKDEMVIGRDLLTALGIIVNFRDGTVKWNGSAVQVNMGKRETKEEQPHQHVQSEVKEINDTLVEPKNMVGAAEIDQKTYEKILELLTRFEKLYNGHLGRMKFPDYILPMAKQYTPIQSRP